MTDKFGLEKQVGTKIISVLSKNIRIESAIIFGSRAKGTYNNGSDIDIALKGNQLNLTDITKLLIELDDFFLPYKFDLIIYNKIEELALRAHIDTYGKCLYEQND